MMYTTMPAKKKEHYLNNKEFLAALIDYKTKVNRAKERGMPKPRVSNYIGECFLKIATHLSYRPNFINYMYKEDMIGDGIENCIQYIDRFDHNKSSNPFAYFTQIVYFAYLRRIAKEKRQLDIRQKIVDRLDYSQLFYGDADDVASMADMNSIKEQINSSYYNR